MIGSVQAQSYETGNSVWLGSPEGREAVRLEAMCRMYRKGCINCRLEKILDGSRWENIRETGMIVSMTAGGGLFRFSFEER